MSCLTTEANGCGDVKRLLAIVGVSLNLLQPDLEAASIVRDFRHNQLETWQPKILILLLFVFVDERGNPPIHYDYASQSIPQSQTLHRRTALR